jgi:hypothetical protein
MWPGVFFRRNKKDSGRVFDLPNANVLAVVVLNVDAERPPSMVDQQPFADFNFIDVAALEYYLAPSWTNASILHVIVKKNDTGFGGS